MGTAAAIWRREMSFACSAEPKDARAILDRKRIFRRSVMACRRGLITAASPARIPGFLLTLAGAMCVFVPSAETGISR